MSILAEEGFLPGYATSREGVVASAERAYSRGWDKFEFDLNRSNSIAIHEHVPGNRIYANGGKYQVSYYKFPASDEVKNPREWAVNPDRFAVKNKLEAEAGYNNPQAIDVPSLPLVDSQLRFISHVEELENTRFRMPSVTAGVLRKRHDGGHRYEFSDQIVDHRESQFVTILNFGPEQPERDHPLGYPICVVCGGVRSPYESEDRLEDFIEYHEERCGEEPQYFALHVHSDVDGLLFTELESQGDAVSLGESLTLVGSHLFDMERDDLRWLPIPSDEGEMWQLFLYDPMPGGSGLLEQFIDEWEEVHTAAQDLLGSCPSACSTSCYDCLRTYYNQFYHDELNRHQALGLIQGMGREPTIANPIEPINEIEEEGDEDTNLWEKRLEDIVCKEWGYSGFEPQGKVDLPSISAYTLPDLFHENAEIAIYLDGPIHTEKEQKKKDKYLRNALKAEGWTVIEIHIEDFENDPMMNVYRTQIGNEIGGH
ncbi:Zn-binding domain-containing protein [Halococcus sp. AFM35]|uniref:Zn-binding domain-containing protein n=1 Tax=Halococcus sp. AFM35 TaxID=3421653 RepID=UPI003EB6C08D